MHLDRGLPLLKHAANTEWTIGRNIAGMTLETIPLLNCVFDGYKNWCLRHLMMGRPTYFVMTKAFDKSCLLYSINAFLRDENMDAIAIRWNDKQVPPAATDSADDKKNLLNKFGEFIGKAIIGGSMLADTNLFQRIQQLEKELVEAKSKASADPTAPKQSNFGKYDRQKPTKVLATDAPENSIVKKVSEWCDKFLTAPKKKKLTKTIEAFKNFVEDKFPHEAARLEALQLALIDHGMPLKLAVEFDKEGAYKVISSLHLKETD